MKVFKFSDDIEISPAIYEFWYQMLKRCYENDSFYLLPPFIEYFDDINDEIELEDSNN